MNALINSTSLCLEELRQNPLGSSGSFEKCKAQKIFSRQRISQGKLKNRFCFDELSEDCYKVAAQRKGIFKPIGEYSIARIVLNGESEEIWLNVNSAAKRFDLPKDVVLKNLPNVNKLVRMVLDRRSAHDDKIDGTLANEEGIKMALLPTFSAFTSSIPLEAFVQKANHTHFCYRVSKRCYHLSRSIDVHPGGFISIDTGKLLGTGSNARVKISTTLEGVKMARRVYTFSVFDGSSQQKVLNTMKIFNEFQGRTGILDTLSMGVYENKLGRCKFVSFHPLYDQDLRSDFAMKPSELDRLEMAHQLLQGFRTIAKLGKHRDITPQNIFIRTKPGFEAVIGDLEFFSYHWEKEDELWNTFPGPEKFGCKREVWDVGSILYYILQQKTVSFPLKITQANLNKSMELAQFPIEIETLLRGMLAIDSNIRWNSKESLEYFEKYLLTRKKREL